jgi:hypothetical protein
MFWLLNMQFASYGVSTQWFSPAGNPNVHTCKLFSETLHTLQYAVDNIREGQDIVLLSKMSRRAVGPSPPPPPIKWVQRFILGGKTGEAWWWPVISI